MKKRNLGLTSIQVSQSLLEQGGLTQLTATVDQVDAVCFLDLPQFFAPTNEDFRRHGVDTFHHVRLAIGKGPYGYGGRSSYR